MPNRTSKEGRLSVVSTPIGNLEDITLRALRILNDVDLILAEDTRRTRRLCTFHNIKTRIQSCHAHSRYSQISRYAQKFNEGSHLALVTDAGTPTISDPGAKLIQAAIEMSIPVESIPGPSAVTAALAVSSFSFGRFRFLGFLPRSGKQRKAILESIALSDEVTVIFESPHRIVQTLLDLQDTVGADRPAVLCRELTKLHEEIARGCIADLRVHFDKNIRGEITLVLAGSDERNEEPDLAELDKSITKCLKQGCTAKDTVDKLKKETTLSKKLIYARVLALQKGDQ